MLKAIALIRNKQNLARMCALGKKQIKRLWTKYKSNNLTAKNS